MRLIFSSFIRSYFLSISIVRLKPTIDEQNEENSNIEINQQQEVIKRQLDNQKYPAEAKTSTNKTNEGHSNESQIGFSGIVKRKQLLHKINEKKVENEHLEHHLQQQQQQQQQSITSENESKTTVSHGIL